MQSVKKIKCTDGDVFESMRSMDQELSFNAASEAFDRYRVDFAEDKPPEQERCSCG